MKCETCKFWNVFEAPLKDGKDSCDLVPDEGYGECKRFPPVMRRPLRDDEDAAETSTTIRPVMFWAQPYTTGEDWCGEWLIRDAKTDQQKEKFHAPTDKPFVPKVIPPHELHEDSIVLMGLAASLQRRFEAAHSNDGIDDAANLGLAYEALAQLAKTLSDRVNDWEDFQWLRSRPGQGVDA